MESRPDPERLLRRIQSDASRTRRGKLKLFFGASPGVGKTYAMLEAARLRQKEGIEVVVGIVETHGRAETAALLEGLEVLPRAESAYRGIILREFDLDGAIKRRPQLVLVDELAHTNAHGSRHNKRWQDVAELLEAGISVYSTMNVQHWESLNDVVAQITGVVVRETVPDTFLQNVDDLEVVDLPPEELLQRLKEGRVYRGSIAEAARANFFKAVNLTALRELALRHAAERVSAEVQQFKESNDIREVWQVTDRLLVGVTSNPMCARLIRAAARSASRLHVPWMALHVETPSLLRSSKEDQNRVAQNLRLAAELGAETIVRTGERVYEEMLRLARERNVTRIIVGKPARPRWREFFRGSVVDALARHCGEIDLHVISGTDSERAPRKPVFTKPSASWPGVAWGIITVATSTLLCAGLFGWTDRVNLAMIFLLGIVWVAYRFGRFPSLIASLLSVISFDFFFVPPRFTFAVADTEYILTFSAMLAVGILVSTLTGRLRLMTEASRQRQSRTEVLYRMSRALAEIHNPAELVAYARAMIENYIEAPTMILVSDDGTLTPGAGNAAAFGSTMIDRGTAEWVFQHGQPAGAGTETLAGASALYVPLLGVRSTVGVLAIEKGALEASDFEQLRLIETFASIVAGSLESTMMAESAGKARAQAENARLKNFVLESFAIDLEQPLDRLAKTALELRRGSKLLTDNARAQFYRGGLAPSVTIFPFCADIIAKGAAETYMQATRLTNLTRALPQIIESRIQGTESGEREKNAGNPVVRVLELDRIVFFKGEERQDEIISQLVSRLDLPDPADAFRAIMEREESAPTVVSSDLAIPHARLDGIEDVRAALGIVRNPGPETSVRLWLLFVSPREPVRNHLSFLAAVTRLFSQPGFAETLLVLDSREEVFESMRQRPAEALRRTGTYDP